MMNAMGEASRQNDRRFEWFTKVGMPIGIAIASCLCTLAYSSFNNRLRTLDYGVVNNPALLKKPETGAAKVTLQVDGKPVENVSTVSVFVFNRTDTDYENIPLHISLASPDGSPPPEILSMNVTAGTASTEITSNQDFKLGIANRSDKPIVQVDYLFAVANPPEVTAHVEKKGLELQRRNLVNKSEGSSGEVTNWTLLCAFSFLLGIIFFTILNIIQTRKLIAQREQIPIEGDGEPKRNRRQEK